MKLPLDSVVSDRTCRVSSLVNCTLAPATAESAESVTVPEIWPVTLCAYALHTADNNSVRLRRVFMECLRNIARQHIAGLEGCQAARHGTSCGFMLGPRH